MNNLPEAGCVWIAGSGALTNGLKPGANPSKAPVDSIGGMVYNEGKNRIGPINEGSLNTFLINNYGDHVHADSNDQIATSPVVTLPEGAVLIVTSSGGGGALAPVFDADPAQGYETGSCGVAVLKASDRSWLASLHTGNKGSVKTDMLDLSAFAGQDVVFEVVDAYEGGWGWLAVQKIEIGSTVAHWKLDETSGSAVADELGNSNGTLVAGADSMWVEGWDGNALAFNDSAYVTVPANDAVEFDSTESFTISMLVKADPIANTAGTGLIHKGDFKKWYQIELKDGQARIAVDDDVNKTQLGVDVTSIWPSNRWAHLVGVRDRADTTLTLYLNGELIGEMKDVTEGDIASPGLPLFIGQYIGGTGGLHEQLDDVKIFNVALDAKTVKTMFESYGIQKDAMIAHWKLNETSGTTVKDELGASNGTLVNGADSMWVKGWDGNALDFAKAPVDTTRILVDNNSAVHFDSTASFTISMLVKADPVGNQAEQWLIHKDLLKYWYGMEFKQGEVRLAVDDDVNKTQLGVKIADIWPSNEWAQLVGVRNRVDATLSLYLNGNLIGTMADKTTGAICDSLPFSIGAYPLHGEGKLDGQLDELKIFNYALNSNAVKAMFDEYKLKSSVAAYWKFDETSGTTVKDTLGASNGTLVNGADSMWVAGQVGNAIDFAKGPDSVYIKVPSNSNVAFDSTESFSISMLVKADPVANQNEQWLLQKGQLKYWYGMEFKQGQVRLAVDDDVTKTQLGVDITNLKFKILILPAGRLINGYIWLALETSTKIL